MFTRIIGILILYCIFTKDIADSRKVNKDFYIEAYNNSKIKFPIYGTVTYLYDRTELLNLSCHLYTRRGQVFWLQWLHNEHEIGIGLKRNEANLLFKINKNNDGDSLKCLASEDMTGLSADEKRVENEVVVMLNFVDKHNNSNPVSSSQIESSNNNGNKLVDDIIEYIIDNKWLVIGITAVVIVVMVAMIILCKRGCKQKEDKVNLKGSTSNCSVITSDPIDGHGLIDNNYYNMPYSGLDVNNVNEYQEPIDNQAYSEPLNYSDPQTLYTQPIPKRFRRNNDGIDDNNYENLDKSNIRYCNTYC